MYYYILDPTEISQKDFDRQQTELQTLLTEHGINGEYAKVSPLRSVRELVDIASHRGATTLVACGTDQTFYQVLANLQNHDFTLAFVPFTKQTQLGKMLGMGDLQNCVKTIASRRTERLDIASLNDDYFISYLELGVATQIGKSMGMLASVKLFASNPITVTMRIDNAYTITSTIMGGLIINTRGTQLTGGTIGNPQDGFLDLLLLEKLTGFEAMRYKSEIQNGIYENIPNSTVIRCKTIEITEPANLKIYINGRESATAPASIELLPQRLKTIVGKKRTF